MYRLFDVAKSAYVSNPKFPHRVMNFDTEEVAIDYREVMQREGYLGGEVWLVKS